MPAPEHVRQLCTWQPALRRSRLSTTTVRHCRTTQMSWVYRDLVPSIPLQTGFTDSALSTLDTLLSAAHSVRTTLNVSISISISISLTDESYDLKRSNKRPVQEEIQLLESKSNRHMENPSSSSSAKAPQHLGSQCPP
jgi:hypothetical protein